METLDGKLHFPMSAEYDRLVVQRETIYTKFPFAIAEVKNVADVQKCILFARKHNFLVSVKTSGHDFLGRSTAHGSLMIYLGSMNDTKVNLSSTRNAAGEITCESGNTWIKVYTEVNIYQCFQRFYIFRDISRTI
jgi:FAD/FMN-containing dehydrogenase